MQESDIIHLWKTYSQTLEESLKLNREHTSSIIRLKIKSHISSMKPLKIFTVLIGILWVGFLDLLIFNLFHVASPFLLISAGLLSVINKLAIGIYIYQLVQLDAVDIDAPVLATQENLAGLKSSTIWIARILFLQLPLWTLFYWNHDMLVNGKVWLWIIQIIITATFTYMAIWLFININYENRDKKWFKMLFSGSEWYPIMESNRLLHEIKDFKS